MKTFCVFILVALSGCAADVESGPPDVAADVEAIGGIGTHLNVTNWFGRNVSWMPIALECYAKAYSGYTFTWTNQNGINDAWAGTDCTNRLAIRIEADFAYGQYVIATVIAQPLNAYCASQGPQQYVYFARTTHNIIQQYDRIDFYPFTGLYDASVPQSQRQAHCDIGPNVPENVIQYHNFYWN